MKGNKLIQVKAAILMVVFALNTIVGFACAVGVDMGFNSDHHHDEAAETTHQHSHHVGTSHHHHVEEAMAHQSKDGKDNCCKDKVTKIAQADKALPQSIVSVSVVFFIALVSFYYVNILPASQIKTDNTYFVRSHHPPIPDIRLAIQSFQI